MNCLALGCAGGDVTFDMAEFVGPSGKVVGIDIDEEKLQPARQDAAQAGIEYTEFRHGDAREISEVQIYDMLYARFLLTYLTDPAALLDRMIAATRPQGAVVHRACRAWSHVLLSVKRSVRPRD